MSTGANYGEVEGKVDQLAGSRSLVKSTKKKVSSAKFTLEKLKNDMEMYLGPEANSVYSQVKKKPNDFLRDRRPIVKMVSTAIMELDAAVLEHNNAQKSLSEANEYAQKGDTTLLDLRILFEKALQRYDDSHWKHVGTLKNMDALRLEYNLMRWEYGIQIHGGSVHPISVQKDGITVNGTFVHNQTTGNYFLNKSKSFARMVPIQQAVHQFDPRPQRPPGSDRFIPQQLQGQVYGGWQLLWVSGRSASVYSSQSPLLRSPDSAFFDSPRQQPSYIQPSDDLTDGDDVIDADADNFLIFIRRH